MTLWQGLKKQRPCSVIFRKFCDNSASHNVLHTYTVSIQCYVLTFPIHNKLLLDYRSFFMTCQSQVINEEALLIHGVQNL